jgi:integral membrane protein (TIGR01906 family)
MDPRFFSREDIAHMQDVRLLAGGAYLSVLISFAVIAFTHGLGLTLPAKAREKLTLGGLTLAIKIQKIVLLVLGLLAMIALVFWRELFILFHQILFPFNSYWLLDPNTSNLIKYFPQGIFQELSLLYILLLVVFSEILQWIAARSSRK